MSLIKRMPFAIMTLAVGAMLTGCFSYHREVSKTSTPAVEPAPSATTSSTTTTTNDDGSVERHTTTTYGNP
jgi:hypothetical protein